MGLVYSAAMDLPGAYISGRTESLRVRTASTIRLAIHGMKTQSLEDR